MFLISPKWLVNGIVLIGFTWFVRIFIRICWRYDETSNNLIETYRPVISGKTRKNMDVFVGTSSLDGGFSIATFDYRRVTTCSARLTGTSTAFVACYHRQKEDLNVLNGTEPTRRNADFTAIDRTATFISKKGAPRNTLGFHWQ